MHIIVDCKVVDAVLCVIVNLFKVEQTCLGFSVIRLSTKYLRMQEPSQKYLHFKDVCSACLANIMHQTKSMNK